MFPKPRRGGSRLGRAWVCCRLYRGLGKNWGLLTRGRRSSVALTPGYTLEPLRGSFLQQPGYTQAYGPHASLPPRRLVQTGEGQRSTGLGATSEGCACGTASAGIAHRNRPLRCGSDRRGGATHRNSAHASRRRRASMERQAMSFADVEPVYYELVIVATSPATAIWLGDDDGHLVQKEIGTLETSLLAGDYMVE